MSQPGLGLHQFRRGDVDHIAPNVPVNRWYLIPEAQRDDQPSLHGSFCHGMGNSQ